MPTKPKVLVLGSPLDYVDKEFFDNFKEDYVVDVLHAKDRAEVKESLADKVAKHGPFRALVIKMGTMLTKNRDGPHSANGAIYIELAALVLHSLKEKITYSLFQHTIFYEPFDEDLLRGLGSDCQIIVSASAGYNEFDIDWMTRAGVWFCNAVYAVSEATADMALFLTLAVVRNTTVAEKQARQGIWKRGLTPSGDPSGKTLGIVGLGGIGKYLAKKAAVFNMKIHYYNRNRLPPEEEAEYAATYCPDLQSLLSSSDIVSLHAPLNPQTTNMISHAEFAAMKDGSYLVNTARGAIVDEDALIQALESGKVARAGLDVFKNEPEISEYFMKSDKVVLQPHMGGLTESSFAKSQKECLENIRAFFETGKPNSPVNKPR